MNRKQRSRLTRILMDSVMWDCPMDRLTTFKVGGRAEAVCYLNKLPLLEQTVSYLHNDNIPFLVVGGGSNLLVREEGIKGVVIILKGELSSIEKAGPGDNTVLAGGGLPLARLMSYCSLEGLSGLEFLAGIPGTVGGAVFMNAGASGMEIGGAVHEVMLVSGEGKQMIIPRTLLAFSYRASSIKNDCVIYRVKIKLQQDKKEKVKKRIAGNLKKKKASQPLDLPSAGSVFKNPPGDFAGRLIEKAGLKGARIGGAMISPEHANYIVNTGGAKAGDVLELMALARDKVKDATGITLEPEIKVVGE